MEKVSLVALPIEHQGINTRHRYHDLILLGGGPSKEGCPFDTETWAALSVLGVKGWEDKPYSKVFCFDPPRNKANEKAGLVVARARGIPIVSNIPYKFYTEDYPTRGVFKMFLGKMMVWNDMSWMIAMALYKGYKNLLLYGVDQGPELLYQMGRPFTTYWLGVATGMGVEWEMAHESMLWRRTL